jgi:hypothetical protein
MNAKYFFRRRSMQYMHATFLFPQGLAAIDLTGNSMCWREVVGRCAIATTKRGGRSGGGGGVRFGGGGFGFGGGGGGGGGPRVERSDLGGGMSSVTGKGRSDECAPETGEDVTSLVHAATCLAPGDAHG